MLRIWIALLGSLTAVAWVAATPSAIAQEPTDKPEEKEEAPHTQILGGSILSLSDMSGFEPGMLEALSTLDTASPNVIIIPHASEESDRGLIEHRAFNSIGITSVSILDKLDGESVVSLLEAADIIWFSDGSPTSLMKALSQHSLASRFHRWRMAGALIGGAGRVAGVLGVTYIEGHVHPPIFVHLAVKPVRGLGLWPGFVVPDAFVDDRIGKTMSGVFDQPRLIALCQGPGSSARIIGDDMHFFGTGASLVIDARKAKKVWVDEKTVHSVTDAKLHSFAMGETYSWFQ